MMEFPAGIRESVFVKNLPHIIGIAVLIFILLFVLVNFGYLRPCDIPGFADIYYSIKGYPRIAIVYGNDGMGNPQLLRSVIIERRHQFPDMIPISNLKTGGVLDPYEMIIVEHARTIDTSVFYAFRDYVQRGGRLVWVGDAGTGLGSDDYMCEEVTISYLPARNYTEVTASCDLIGSEEEKEKCLEGRCDELSGYYKIICESVAGGGTVTQCGEWIEEKPLVPEESWNDVGICGQNFGEVVVEFISQNATIYAEATQPPLFLCPSESKPYVISGADRILDCIDRLDRLYPGESITEQLVNGECSFGINYWRRGPSETLTGERREPIDFGSIVLGMDYVGSRHYPDESMTTATNLFLQPLDPDHRLVRGYQARAQWFGTANYSLVDASQYTYRTKSLMNLNYEPPTIEPSAWPAVVVSSPVGPLLTKTGLVIYYAFPPEIGAEPEPAGESPERRGMGLNLIDNLIDFVLCK
jgi:hypothetical protein